MAKVKKKKANPVFGALRAPYGKKQVKQLREHMDFHQRFLDAQTAMNHKIEQDRLRAIAHHRGLI